MSVLAASSDYPLLNVMWTMFAFFLWVLWFWLLITVLSDLFRRTDVSGWSKAGWTVLVLVVPFFGVFMYLITQGQRMQERQMSQRDRARGDLDRSYDRPSNGHVTSEISEAKQLLDSGAITQAEFDTMKQKALA